MNLILKYALNMPKSYPQKLFLQNLSQAQPKRPNMKKQTNRVQCRSKLSFLCSTCLVFRLYFPPRWLRGEDFTSDTLPGPVKISPAERWETAETHGKY